MCLLFLLVLLIKGRIKDDVNTRIPSGVSTGTVISHSADKLNDGVETKSTYPREANEVLTYKMLSSVPMFFFSFYGERIGIKVLDKSSFFRKYLGSSL